MRRLVELLVVAAAALFAVGSSAASEDAKLVLVAQNLRNDTGSVSFLVFDKAQGFPSDPGQARFRGTVKPKEGRARLTLDKVPQGTYAVAALHDENENGKLDRNWLGAPTEGYGASNNPPPRNGPPRFDESKFVIDNTQKSVNIRVIYR